MFCFVIINSVLFKLLYVWILIITGGYKHCLVTLFFKIQAYFTVSSVKLNMWQTVHAIRSFHKLHFKTNRKTVTTFSQSMQLERSESARKQKKVINQSIKNKFIMKEGVGAQYAPSSPSCVLFTTHNRPT